MARIIGMLATFPARFPRQKGRPMPLRALAALLMLLIAAPALAEERDWTAGISLMGGAKYLDESWPPHLDDHLARGATLTFQHHSWPVSLVVSRLHSHKTYSDWLFAETTERRIGARYTADIAPFGHRVYPFLEGGVMAVHAAMKRTLAPMDGLTATARGYWVGTGVSIPVLRHVTAGIVVSQSWADTSDSSGTPPVFGNGMTGSGGITVGVQLTLHLAPFVFDGSKPRDPVETLITSLPHPPRG